MTPAEVIAKVRAHAEAQRTPCIQDNGEAAYRHDGKACLIGCLLGSWYLPSFEGHDPGDSIPVLSAVAKATSLPLNQKLKDLVEAIDSLHHAWLHGRAPTDSDWSSLIDNHT